jgi:hypothetical protein
MVEIQSVAVFSCEKGENIDNPSPDSVGVLDSDDFDTDGGREVERICTAMVGEALGRNYNSSETKNARTHEFTDRATEVSAPVDGVDMSIREVLDAIRNETDVEENARVLSQLYLDEIQSRADLLITVHYEKYEEDFVAVLKTPYLEGAHEIDLSDSETTEVFIENERVIQEETDKSVLYPQYDVYEEEMDTGRAQLFQANGASHYSSYWYGFLQLAEKKHPDELVERGLKDQARESETGAAFGSYREFIENGSIDTESDSMSSVENGEVTIRIAGRSLRVSLEELRDSRNVQIARDGDQFYLVLSDIEPEVTVGSGQGRKSVFGTLDGVPNVEDIF